MADVAETADEPTADVEELLLFELDLFSPLLLLVLPELEFPFAALFDAFRELEQLLEFSPPLDPTVFELFRLFDCCCCSC